jgi:hypothetical protein
MGSAGGIEAGPRYPGSKNALSWAGLIL